MDGTMRLTTSRFAVVLLLLTGLVGCGLIFDVSPFETPIEYQAVYVVTGARGALHDRAGLYYELANTSGRTVARLDIAFELYDREGWPVPRAGAHSHHVMLDTIITAGTTARFCTSLDSLVGEHADGVSPARFRVRRAVFSDGSSWRNLTGSVYTEEIP
jgi:hypothetical protein